ncbi:MAG: hypothetical protein OXM61_10090 [Candidatus Poribacteria bacterium]|nr:hypothetical protein [Candidatus Poribacteria bacterium]
MRISKRSRSVIFVAVIFSFVVGFSMILHPETYSMEPFMLAAIATFLAGIYVELNEMNKQKRESDKRLSDTDEKLNSE